MYTPLNNFFLSIVQMGFKSKSSIWSHGSCERAVFKSVKFPKYLECLIPKLKAGTCDRFTLR